MEFEKEVPDLTEAQKKQEEAKILISVFSEPCAKLLLSPFWQHR